MAPPRKRTGPVASDPYQNASRLLLYLKLKVAAVKTDPSSRLLRDAIKAAEELEGCMASLESGPPALQLALAQVGLPISDAQQVFILGHDGNPAARLTVSTIIKLLYLQSTLAGANKLLEQSKQLSADAGTLALSLRNVNALPDETIWVLLRPVLRLCLWLLPEHIHASAPQAVQQAASFAEGSSRDTTSVDWRQDFALSFVRSVATVSDRAPPGFVYAKQATPILQCLNSCLSTS
jgi:hypothetical protein